MKKIICAFVLCLVFGLGVTAAQAATPVPIDGQVAGIELCPQFICGAAIFAGGFQGKIGINPNAAGVIAAALTHGDLPTEVGKSAPIYTGVWELRSLLRRFSGIVAGGQIVYLGDNRFHVTATLILTSGSTGAITLDGILDHNPTIPTFGGSLH
jgi:hypothetical protein